MRKEWEEASFGLGNVIPAPSLPRDTMSSRTPSSILLLNVSNDKINSYTGTHKMEAAPKGLNYLMEK